MKFVDFVFLLEMNIFRSNCIEEELVYMSVKNDNNVLSTIYSGLSESLQVTLYIPYAERT